MIIPEKQNIEFKENTILEVKSGILIMESKIKNKKNSRNLSIHII